MILLIMNLVGLTMLIYKCMTSRKISFKVRKRLLERRTRIFTNWLKITFEKPYTIFLAAVFPFAQAFLASVMMIYTAKPNSDISASIILFIVACCYYFAFAMNSKRATKGSWLGLLFLILFGALGILCGKLLIA